MRRIAGGVVALLTMFVVAAPVAAHDIPIGQEMAAVYNSPHLAAAFAADQPLANTAVPVIDAPCEDGFAAGYACSNVDLLAYMPLADVGGGNANDIWGWTDPVTGEEYALLGKTTGTAFINITDPLAPVYLGELPTQTSSSSWRDIKIDGDYAFIVSEASNHGMQVFDLTRLRGATGVTTWTTDAHYNQFGNAHNIAVNEDTNFAYAVGTGTCSGGLHMIDISDPLSPSNAGCFSSDGYTHDVQCVVYNGPDASHVGSEICVASNEDTVTVVDVTNKSAPVQLSRKRYRNSSYTHQGWLTEDHKYFLLDDELDEANRGLGTTTYIWDMTNIDSPVMISASSTTNPSIDHNQYVLGDYSYQANYRSGLRIQDISNVAGGTMSEAAFFDIYPGSDSAAFNGAWSVFPYFDSGVIIVSGIEQGLFVLRANLDSEPPPPPPDDVVAHVGDLDASASITTGSRYKLDVTVAVHDAADVAVAGVTVSGTFSNNQTGSCVTAADGTCEVSNDRFSTRRNPEASFTVSSVSGTGVTYSATANHDPDGDSDGTTILVTAP